MATRQSAGWLSRAAIALKGRWAVHPLRSARQHLRSLATRHFFMRIACFFSTSGHSGVDRAARHLIPALARRGFTVDLLKVRGHGPELTEVPAGVRILDLGLPSHLRRPPSPGGAICGGSDRRSCSRTRTGSTARPSSRASSRGCPPVWC